MTKGSTHTIIVLTCIGLLWTIFTNEILLSIAAAIAGMLIFVLIYKKISNGWRIFFCITIAYLLTIGFFPTTEMHIAISLIINALLAFTIYFILKKLLLKNEPY